MGGVVVEAKTNQLLGFFSILVLLVLVCIAYWFVRLSILLNMKQFGCIYIFRVQLFFFLPCKVINRIFTCVVIIVIGVFTSCFWFQKVLRLCCDVTEIINKNVFSKGHSLNAVNKASRFHIQGHICMPFFPPNLRFLFGIPTFLLSIFDGRRSFCHLTRFLWESYLQFLCCMCGFLFLLTTIIYVLTFLSYSNKLWQKICETEEMLQLVSTIVVLGSGEGWQFCWKCVSYWFGLQSFLLWAW